MVKVFSDFKTLLFKPYFTSTPDYSVNITNGIHNHNGYVEMKNGQQYGVTIKNNTSTSCQSSLMIDGKHMGDFLVDKYSSITVDRPVHSHKKFTFYRTDSISSIHTGIVAGKYQNGLVEVTIIPAKNIPIKYVRNNYSQSMNCSSLFDDSLESCFRAPIINQYQEGGTALSGYSDQHFKYVEPPELDYNKQITLSYRLVARNYDVYDYNIEPISIRHRAPPPVSVFTEPYINDPFGRVEPL